MSASQVPIDSSTVQRSGRMAACWKGVGLILGRSLFPLLALSIILGTLLWGPWVTLALALVCFGVISLAA